MPATGRRCVSRGYAWGHKGDGGLPLQGACHPGGGRGRRRCSRTGAQTWNMRRREVGPARAREASQE